mmetsp:Transcript_19269/g.29237  ORF Transcript_19269/g.29237 Transcript_19269/m.29237 type:complete len:460 (+) Transcript_19269:51-1430(+)
MSTLQKSSEKEQRGGWMMKLSNTLNSAAMLSPPRRRNEEETKQESPQREVSSSYLDLSAKRFFTSSTPIEKTDNSRNESSSPSSLSAAAEQVARYGLTSTAQFATASAQSAGAAAAWSKASATAAVQSFETAMRKTVAGESSSPKKNKPASPSAIAPSKAALDRLRYLHELALEGVQSPRFEPELRSFWEACFSLLSSSDTNKLSIYERRGESWRRLGFATQDPSDAIRAGGLLSLRALEFLIDRYPEKSLFLLNSHTPLGEAGVAVCREIARLCDIGSPLGLAPRQKTFWGALEEPETFFELVAIGLSVFGREYLQINQASDNGRRDNARLAAAVRAATREIDALLAQAPQSQNDLILLAQTVPASPQHDKITALCGHVAQNSATNPHYFRNASLSYCSSTEDDDDEDVDESKQLENNDLSSSPQHTPQLLCPEIEKEVEVPLPSSTSTSSSSRLVDI